eukprot:gene14882-biopygen7483
MPFIRAGNHDDILFRETPKPSAQRRRPPMLRRMGDGGGAHPLPRQRLPRHAAHRRTVCGDQAGGTAAQARGTAAQWRHGKGVSLWEYQFSAKNLSESQFVWKILRLPYGI